MPLSNFIKIINNEFGNVAVSTRKIPKGLLVRVLNGQNVKSPTRTSIQWGHEANRRHVEDNIGKYINHSCDPTLRVDGAMPYLWAVKDIAPNTALTFNYIENEDNISSSFICNECGLPIPRNTDCEMYKY